jgi:hypothetical protein
MKDERGELVRIDAKGDVHPVGLVANQRLRARTGTYRMLPAPGHVVLMRYAGEGGQRDPREGDVVRLAGEINAPGTMADVLAMLAQTGWRGELVVLDGENSRSIFFEQGFVVGALTSVDEERLGKVLYRYGAITEAQLETLVERLAWGQRIGEAAVDTGMLTQERVYEFIRKQVQEVVYATLTVSDGTFFFLDGFDAGRLVARHAVSAQSLLMEGVTRLDEMRYFRQKIPSADHVPCRVEGAGDPPPEFSELHAAVDGRLSIEELGRLTAQGEFETTKAVYQLVQSKHLVVRAPRLSGGPEAIVASANVALGSIFRALADHAKMAAVRGNLARFAVGTGDYSRLLRGAGPDERGLLDPETVAGNLRAVGTDPDAEERLRHMLHEYISFALFSAGAALGPEREVVLSRQVGPVLSRLRPPA